MKILSDVTDRPLPLPLSPRRGEPRATGLRKFASAGLMAAILLLTVIAPRPAKAQGGTFDAFGGFITTIASAPQFINNLGNTSVTNAAVVDLRELDGVAKLDVYYMTNGPGTANLTLYTSPDLATWVALNNIAIAKQSTYIYTNNYYGTNGLTATNTYNLPGAVITPTAATAGWATPYLDASTPFTNSGAITLTGGRVTTLGFRLGDANRYLQFVWGTGGTVTNLDVGAILTAKKRGGGGATP